jgi:hypothetical protein
MPEGPDGEFEAVRGFGWNDKSFGMRIFSQERRWLMEPRQPRHFLALAQERSDHLIVRWTPSETGTARAASAATGARLYRA